MKTLLPMPALNDPEGVSVPASLPPAVDAHVHLFPRGLFAAIWNWFDNFGWPIRYRLASREITDFLFSRGIEHIVALHYAHAPGIAAQLNSYMAGLCAENPRITGTATVFPGEENARRILQEGFGMGLKGVKLHAHVQFFHMDSPEMEEIYEVCSENDKPLVMHVGREPKNPDFPYKCDPYECCAAERLEAVLKAYPRLRICVPHLGADEFDAYRGFLEVYDNLWVDTTMVLADYLPIGGIPDLEGWRQDRIMYGTDFPNIPYAWDRELRQIVRIGLSEELLARLLGGNAAELFSINLSSRGSFASVTPF